MSVEIVRLEEEYFERLRIALDEVAREKRYLAFTQAPPAEDALAFYRRVLANDWVHYVGLLEGKVVGWCDILPVMGEARAHVGVLGMGVVAAARHRGIGTALIRHAIDRAWDVGLSRIQLTVRTDNARAKVLYDRFGFKVEGINVRAFMIEGQFYDTYSMALLR